jgi:hypothetical protein
LCVTWGPTLTEKERGTGTVTCPKCNRPTRGEGDGTIRTAAEQTMDLAVEEGGINLRLPARWFGKPAGAPDNEPRYIPNPIPRHPEIPNASPKQSRQQRRAEERRNRNPPRRY